MCRMSFIDAVAAGAAVIDDMDDYIDYWHDHAHVHNDAELHEYLGMSWDEYGQWLMPGDRDAVLQGIVDSRRRAPLPVAV